MAAMAISLFVLEGEASIAPARSSENDLKLEEVGREATGLAISGLPASLISISPDDWLIDQILFWRDESDWNIDTPELQAAFPFSPKECARCPWIPKMLDSEEEKHGKIGIDELNPLVQEGDAER